MVPPHLSIPQPYEKKYDKLIFSVHDDQVDIYLEHKSNYLYTIPASIAEQWAEDMHACFTILPN